MTLNTLHILSAAVGIPILPFIEDLQTATIQDMDLQRITMYKIRGWLHTKLK